MKLIFQDYSKRPVSRLLIVLEAGAGRVGGCGGRLPGSGKVGGVNWWWFRRGCGQLLLGEQFVLEFQIDFIPLFVPGGGLRGAVVLG